MKFIEISTRSLYTCVLYNMLLNIDSIVTIAPADEYDVDLRTAEIKAAIVCDNGIKIHTTQTIQEILDKINAIEQTTVEQISGGLLGG